MTVTGPMSADELGMTSIHEHIFCDLTRDVQGRDSLLNNVELAYQELMRFKDAGGSTIIDQTTAGLRGHDNDLLPVNHAIAVRQMAERTGLNIILGAGWYRETYYEQRLYRMKTDEIAEELVRDVEEGIDGTDVRAGVLGEIGAHFTWVSPVEERVFRAVARAHKKTGLTILTHAINSSVGLDQLDILVDEGVDPRRVVIGHCQSHPYHEYHAEIARRGAFVAFDRLAIKIEFEHQSDLRLIKQMVDAGLTDHLVFGQDVCRRTDYVAYGGNGYGYIPTMLPEELSGVGVSEEIYQQVTVDNARRALTGEDR
jgi:phosphotriesterase-related protein